MCCPRLVVMKPLWRGGPVLLGADLADRHLLNCVPGTAGPPPKEAALLLCYRSISRRW